DWLGETSRIVVPAPLRDNPKAAFRASSTGLASLLPRTVTPFWSMVAGWPSTVVPLARTVSRCTGADFPLVWYTDWVVIESTWTVPPNIDTPLVTAVAVITSRLGSLAGKSARMWISDSSAWAALLSLACAFTSPTANGPRRRAAAARRNPSTAAAWDG